MSDSYCLMSSNECPLCFNAFCDGTACYEEALEEIQAAYEAFEKRRTLPPVDEYGICTGCRRRRNTGCACGMTFAEKIKTVGLDEEALRIFNMGGKGRKKGKDSWHNKRGA